MTTNSSTNDAPFPVLPPSSPPPTPPPILMSEKDFNTVTNTFFCLMVVIGLIGMLTNALSIRTFILLGLRDGISVSLLALALSDFGFTACGFFLGAGNVVYLIEVTYGLTNLPVHPRWVVGMFAVNTSNIFLEIGAMTTTFLGVARCMCVALPFRFKDFFTSAKSLTVQLVFLFIALVSYIPVLSQMGTQRNFDPEVNRTRVVLWMSSLRGQIKNVVYISHYIVFQTITSVVVLVCVVIMARYLRQSIEFRLKSSDRQFSDGKSNTNKNSTATTTSSAKDGNPEGDVKLSGRELSAVRQVLAICVIYVVCMVPGLVVAIYRPINPQFDIGKRLQNYYIVAGDVGTTFGLVNSATTFFVYYAYNSKFRQACFSFRRPQK